MRGRAGRRTSQTSAVAFQAWVASSIHPAACTAVAQLCPPSSWLPVWYSYLLSRQFLTQVVMTARCSPDRQRWYLPELCHHLKQQSSSNQQNCRPCCLRPAHAVCQLLVALLWGLGTRPAPVPICCRREAAAPESIRTLEIAWAERVRKPLLGLAFGR